MGSADRIDSASGTNPGSLASLSSFRRHREVIVAANPLAPDWLVEPSDANSLDAAVWPRHASRAASGALEIAGVAAPALHAAYGTPLYVVDEHDARARADGIRDAFSSAFAPRGAQTVVYYAG